MRLLSFLLFFFSCTTLTLAQTIYPDYVDGAIYLKIKENSGIILSEFDRSEKNDKPSSTTHRLQEIIQKYEIVSIYRPFIHLNTSYFDHVYRIAFNDTKLVESLIRDLQKKGFVEYAEKIPLYKLSYEPNDPDATDSRQWYLATIKAYEAWNIHKNGSTRPVVAIVDDGLLSNHEDIQQNLWINTAEQNGRQGVDDDGNGWIDDLIGWDVADRDNNPAPPSFIAEDMSHGTHCAGIAAGATDNGKGIASISFNSVRIMSCKAMSDNTEDFRLTHAVEGITYAVRNGATIISCSFGSPNPSQPLQEAISLALSQGIIVVAAAGNENTDTRSYPAAYNGVIAVASSYLQDRRSNFSNYGSWVNITAPGSYIRSSVATSQSAYDDFSGTSMACPMVAGLLALMKSYKPSATANELVSCLLSSADNIDNVNPGYAGQLGAGRINAEAALRCLAGSSSCTTPTGLTASNLTEEEGRISWNPVSGAEYYTVEIRVVGTTNWFSFNDTRFTNPYVNVTGFAACTQYEFRVKASCGSSSSGFSSPFTFKTSGNCYCDSYGESTDFEWIQKVGLGTINNNSGDDGGYGDYTHLSTDLAKGQTHIINLFLGLSGSLLETESWKVWIDFNRDGDFNDPGEEIIAKIQDNNQPLFLNFSIPSSVASGPAIMRVSLKYAGEYSPGAQSSACAVFEYGEVEDYTINILEAPACTAPRVSDLSASNITDASAVLSCTVAAEQYKFRLRKANTSDWITSSAFTNNSVDATSLSANQRYEFQAQIKCGEIWSAWSGSQTFTTLAGTTNINNDEPCNAVTLVVGSSCSFQTFSNESATRSSQPGASQCPSSSMRDVWFKVQIPSSGRFIVNSEKGTLTDGIMAFYSGSCTNLSEFGCQDDSNGNLMPAASISGPPGNWVHIRFWGYNGDRGTFKICVQAASGFNDDISGREDNLPNAFTLSETPTYVEENHPQVKHRGDLFIYPIPLAGSDLNLSYTLPSSAEARITVTDISGKIIQQVQLGFRNSGAHTDLLNVNSIPAGIYLIRLDADRFSETKKFIITR